MSPLWAAAILARNEPRRSLSRVLVTTNVLSKVRSSIGSSRGTNRVHGDRGPRRRARRTTWDGRLTAFDHSKRNIGVLSFLVQDESSPPAPPPPSALLLRTPGEGHRIHRGFQYANALTGLGSVHGATPASVVSQTPEEPSQHNPIRGTTAQLRVRRKGIRNGSETVS